MTVATTPVVRLQRTLAAAPDRVFDAWLDPKALMQIFRMSPTDEADAVTDPRVGGRFLLTLKSKNTYPHTGEYLVVDRPHKLVFTWFSKGTDLAETKVTIELKPAKGGGTELTLTHVGLTEKQVASHEGGWTAIVGNLEKMLA
jgi:uncharacterized protein YndB with AHSA1/START domain